MSGTSLEKNQWMYLM